MDTGKKIYVLNDVEYKIIKGKKRWYVEYYQLLQSGVRKRRKAYGQVNYIKDLERREEACIQLINKISGGAFDTKKQLPSVLRDAIADNEDYRESTATSYKSIVNNFLDWLKKEDILCTENDAKTYMSHLRRVGLHQNRRHNIRGVLSSLYNRSKAATNPFKHIKIQKLSAKSPYYFDDEQIAELLEVFADTPVMSLAIRLLFYCFIRPREMRQLRVGDVILNRGVIEVLGDVSKNKKTQTVAIPHIFLPELDYLKRYPLDYYIITKTGEPGPKKVGVNFLNTRHRKMLKKLKYSPRYSLYSWKHTGVVKAWKARIDLKTLQMQLRHGSLDMVNEYLKNLGVLDSDVLRHNFPDIVPTSAAAA